MKNAICKRKNILYFGIINLQLLYKMLSQLLTVCKSLLKIIKVIKPAKMTKGVRLNRAKNFPKRSPENLHMTFI